MAIKAQDPELNNIIEFDEDDANVHRPEWFPWYYTKWAESTALFDAEQRGWYLNLLMFAASQGTPPGYLENDDFMLKEVAGFSELPREMNGLKFQQLTTRAIMETAGEDSHQHLAEFHKWLNDIRIARSKKWDRVIGKFRPSKVIKDQIYNPKLVATLKQTYKKFENFSKAGKISANLRWGNSLKKEGLSNDVTADVTNIRTTKPVTKSENVTNNVVTTILDKELPKRSPNGDPKGYMDNSGNGVNGQSETVVEQGIFPELNQPEIPSTNPSKPKTRKARQRLEETLFEESGWVFTDKHKEHLMVRYPQFKDQDIEYMVYRFTNSFTGKWYQNWTATFYNFVQNQVYKWGYKPGGFRGHESEMANPSQSTTTNQTQFDKRTQRENAVDDYIKQLQGDSSTDDPGDQETLLD